ncbi:MAG: DUF1015 family protein [Bacteroidia bacterium]
MARINPFKALLPQKGLEVKVSANTHVDDLKRQTEIVNTNPLTYLNVVKPYLRFNEAKDPARHFPYAKSSLRDLIGQKAMYQDSEECFYIYFQTDKNHTHEFMGLIATLPVEDYYNGKIKIHEKTLTEKEEQLILHIENSGAIGEPVLITHPKSQDILDALIQLAEKSEEIMHFDDEINRHHRLIRINDPAQIAQLKDAYASVKDFYIADGHHRSSASAGYFKKHNIIDGHYLAYIVPPGYLKIGSFYRAYKSLGKFDANHFLNLMKEEFEIETCDSCFNPEDVKTFGLLIGENWYRLKYKGSSEGLNSVESLDVSILEEHVFKQKLNIHDSKTDKQLSFLKGTMPNEVLINEMKAGLYDAVFTVHPCTIQEVFAVADEGLIMPPKSTFIEPKLRTGLTVQLV